MIERKHMDKKKIENLTLEELEKDIWETPSNFPTSLVENVYSLRKKRLIDYDANDIRILISQNVGLKYVVPKAIQELEKNILVEACYYPGDLLLTLLKISDYWITHTEERNKIIALLKKSKQSIIEELNVDDETDQDILKSIDQFIFSHKN